MDSRDLEGFAAPIHRGLTIPVLLGGVPRTMAILIWGITMALVFGLHEAWVLPLGIVLHIGALLATKADPHFFDIITFTIKVPERLDP